MIVHSVSTVILLLVLAAGNCHVDSEKTIWIAQDKGEVVKCRRHINIVTAKLIRSIIYNLDNKNMSHCDSLL